MLGPDCAGVRSGAPGRERRRFRAAVLGGGRGRSKGRGALGRSSLHHLSRAPPHECVLAPPHGAPYSVHLSSLLRELQPYRGPAVHNMQTMFCVRVAPLFVSFAENERAPSRNFGMAGPVWENDFTEHFNPLDFLLWTRRIKSMELGMLCNPDSPGSYGCLKVTHQCSQPNTNIILRYQGNESVPVPLISKAVHCRSLVFASFA